MGEIKELKTLEEEPHLPSPILSKRKTDVDSATEDSDPSKKLKNSDSEIPIAASQENHNSTAEETQEDKESNGNSRIDKGKAVLRDDKGKGKAKVEEEEEEEDDSSTGSGGSSEEGSDDGVENNGGDDDSDISDDPLAEVDLDNILPSRTRRRAAEPGAYLVNDMDEDDDDDDDDVEEDAEDDDSE